MPTARVTWASPQVLPGPRNTPHEQARLFVLHLLHQPNKLGCHGTALPETNLRSRDLESAVRRRATALASELQPPQNDRVERRQRRLLYGIVAGEPAYRRLHAL